MARSYTAAQWTTSNFVLALGEVGRESDTGRFKTGDGSTAWNSLLYNSITAARISDASASGLTVLTGTAAAGKNALGIGHLWTPARQGYIAWNQDPVVCNATSSPTAGTLYAFGIYLDTAQTITNLHVSIATLDAALTSGQNFAGLYQGNTLLAATADQTTPWATTGVKTMALTSAQAVTAGLIYVAFYARGNTTLAFNRGGSSAPVNAGLSSPNFRVATANTGLTTALPSTMGAQTNFTSAYWVAVS